MGARRESYRCIKACKKTKLPGRMVSSCARSCVESRVLDCMANTSVCHRPLGLSGSTCPTSLVKCDGFYANPACCPSGTECSGSGPIWCCPTGVDCKSYLTNFPQCADPANVMYVQNAILGYYFCCPPNQFGVLPLQNQGGFCQDSGTPVEASRIASKAKDQKTIVEM